MRPSLFFLISVLTVVTVVSSCKKDLDSQIMQVAMDPLYHQLEEGISVTTTDMLSQILPQDMNSPEAYLKTPETRMDSVAVQEWIFKNSGFKQNTIQLTEISRKLKEKYPSVFTGDTSVMRKIRTAYREHNPNYKKSAYEEMYEKLREVHNQ